MDIADAKADIEVKKIDIEDTITDIDISQMYGNDTVGILLFDKEYLSY